MATKTDRILGYLPGTFRARPRPTALFALVDAFGSELLGAENSLAAIMQAHWVDHADRPAEVVDDLARMGALYGLAPRPDESVEEFREHLKRYIRTFLEGTVTVQGILRVAADTLGLRIAGAYPELDTWWTRSGDELVTVERGRHDAAMLVLGVEAAEAGGAAAQAAEVTGTVDLGAGVDLRGGAILRLAVDGGPPVTVDLGSPSDPGSVSIDQIMTSLHQAVPGVARRVGSRLALSSTTSGPDSRLEVIDGDEDAAEAVLGLPPRRFTGTDPVAAEVRGTVDWGAGVDLADGHYLRVQVDGALAEVDCRGPGGQAGPTTSLDQVRAAVNDALGIAAAGHDGHFLALRSPTTGSASVVMLEPAAAQDATARLFGTPPPRRSSGLDAQPARLTGRRDLGAGVNLSVRLRLALRFDGQPPVTIECAGEEPSHTLLSEIVAAVNEAMGAALASHDGHRLTIVSPTVGPAGSIEIDAADDGDASLDILGIGPREFSGRLATNGVLAGTVDLRPAVDLQARNLLALALDGGPSVEIDLRAAAEDPGRVTPLELVRAVNEAVGADVASLDGGRLVLSSPGTGTLSRLAVRPREQVVRRRFVSRATVLDEAAFAVLGVASLDVAGVPETAARVQGSVDLRRGADLRQDRHLRLTVDGRPAVEIDCAGPRAGATTLAEVVAKINDAVGDAIATDDGRHLVLTSQVAGPASRIAVERSNAADSSHALLAVAPGEWRGADATRVILVGTVDLAAGVDLPPGAAVAIGVDGAPPVEVPLTGATGEHLTLGQLAVAINARLGSVIAEADGTRIRLSSPRAGVAGGIELAEPGGDDVTMAILGFAPPRSYQGRDATQAIVTGARDHAGTIDLSVTRFLRIAVDGAPAKDVDCTGSAGLPSAELDDVVAAINAGLGATVAAAAGDRLLLSSPTTGLSSRVSLERYSSPGAGQHLLGTPVVDARGEAGAPAEIVGRTDLLAPVDLSQHGVVRISVDGGRPLDIDITGAAPSATFLDEIVRAVNAELPGVAAATDDNRLRLATTTAGPESRLSVLPRRCIEVVEYLPEGREDGPQEVRHGDHWSVVNDGAADEPVEVTVRAPRGAVGPAVQNRSLGWQARVLAVLSSGDTVLFRKDPLLGVRADIVSAAGVTRPVPGTDLIAGPIGSQAAVPFHGPRRLSAGGEGPPALQLNDPATAQIVRLRLRPDASPGAGVSVTVADAAGPPDADPLPAPDGRVARRVGRVAATDAGHALLRNGDAGVLAELRPGPVTDLAPHRGRVVAVTGALHEGDPLVMVVDEVVNLFDVRLGSVLPAEGSSEELYESVTIGAGADRPDSLVGAINGGQQPSRLVTAEEVDRGSGLALVRGRSEWSYFECLGSRFDEARFTSRDSGAWHFSGGHPCAELGIFDASRFHDAAEPVAPVFATAGPRTDPPVDVAFRWVSHRPGTLAVNLPAELPARFGARFNHARFGRPGDEPEVFAGAVTEPPGDPSFLFTLLNEGSKLVLAKVVNPVPIGWSAVEMPFRTPRRLTLGSADQAAQLYLAEEGFAGFLRISAREPGEWGNDIAVAARRAGPGRFDVTVAYEAARFESARQVVAGLPAGPSGAAVVGVGPVGVLQAKAAGVWAHVTRDQAGPDQ